MKNLSGIKFKTKHTNQEYTIKDKGGKNISVVWAEDGKTGYSRKDAMKYLKDGSWVEQDVTPTLEEVKRHFKDAKVVKCLEMNVEVDISQHIKKDVHLFCNSYFIDLEERHYEDISVALWYKEKGYAEIISRKEKFEITKETAIKYNMRKEFPELFEVKLKVGEWYKYDNNLLVWNGGNNTYGFWNGVFVDELSFSLNGEIAKNVVKTTPQEVKEALINEAVNRGFKDGVDFNSCKGIYRNGLPGYWINDNLDMMSFNGKYIFNKGQWVEIIPQKEMTLKEIEEELGYKIKIKQ